LIELSEQVIVGAVLQVGRDVQERDDTVGKGRELRGGERTALQGGARWSRGV
jgi:hypothetical protein